MNPASLKAKLRVVEGAKDVTFRLKLPATIGRSEGATLKVPHAQVSRKHCEIYHEDGWLVVNDLGSSNGSFVDGVKISEPTFLYPGERLRVGKVVLEAIYDAPEEVTSDPDGTEIVLEEVAENSPRDSKPQRKSREDVLDHEVDVASSAESSSHENSAIVSYEETEQGSFLGIEEIETGSNSPAPSDSASGFSIHTEHETRKPINPQESALDHFLKGLK